ncbi:uncharacterized protein LOC141596506 [Silene latifolia]|uniref:uncharacterized protein LOC141596506 n=1 Tax=Silene latifolia TaxID=37657 RepID=UPI003D76C17A
MDRHLSTNGGAEAILGFQPNSTVSVAYHPDFGAHDELLLLELDEKLLPDVLCERVSLRGEPDEEAVFCTQSKTYAIKFVGNSNSVFLVPPSSLGENLMDCEDNSSDLPALASVLKVASGNLELLEVSPKLDKLRFLLSQNPFSYEEATQMDLVSSGEEGKTGLYRWDDLIGRIQASDVELRLALEALDAIEVNGYWRIVDDHYMDSVLSMLLNNAILNDWPLDALPENEVVSKLESDDGFPAKLATHCLRVYGNIVNDDNSNDLVWKLDEKRVCVHIAKRILKGGKVKMEKFMEEWRCKVPDVMQARFEMLESEVLIERIGVETWVRAFSISSLPSTPAERFSILFKERPKWEWKDLEPYIRDLKVPGLSAEGLLLKFTRRSQPSPDVEPIFSAR